MLTDADILRAAQRIEGKNGVSIKALQAELTTKPHAKYNTQTPNGNRIIQALTRNGYRKIGIKQYKKTGEDSLT